MGIKGLNEFLRKKCPDVFQEVHLSEYGFKKVAVDISYYIHRFTHRYSFNGNEVEDKSRWLNPFIDLIACLRNNEIHCIFVFDTHTNAPQEKSKEREKRTEQKEKQELQLFELQIAVDKYYSTGEIDPLLIEVSKKRMGNQPKKLLRVDENILDMKLVEEHLQRLKCYTVKVDEDDFLLAKEMFDILNVPYDQAEGEAEKTCSTMCVHNQVEAVLSEDTDIMVYETPKFLSKIDTKTNTCVEVDYPKLLEELEFTSSQFRDFCIMCGNDYNSNIPKVGPVNAYKLIKQYGSIDEIQKQTKYNITVLNHIKSRELFTVPPSFELKVSYCGEPDLEELEKFIFKNNCKVNMDKVRKSFAPKEMIFVSDEETEE